MEFEDGSGSPDGGSDSDLAPGYEHYPAPSARRPMPPPPYPPRRTASDSSMMHPEDHPRPHSYPHPNSYAPHTPAMPFRGQRSDVYDKYSPDGLYSTLHQVPAGCSAAAPHTQSRLAEPDVTQNEVTQQQHAGGSHCARSMVLPGLPAYSPFHPHGYAYLSHPMPHPNYQQEQSQLQASAAPFVQKHASTDMPAYAPANSPSSLTPPRPFSSSGNIRSKAAWGIQGTSPRGSPRWQSPNNRPAVNSSSGQQALPPTPPLAFKRSPDGSGAWRVRREQLSPGAADAAKALYSTAGSADSGGSGGEMFNSCACNWKHLNLSWHRACH